MSEKPKYAAEWFEWFQKEELPRIYRAEKGLPPTDSEVDDAMEFLRKQLATRHPHVVIRRHNDPLDWKLPDEDKED